MVQATTTIPYIHSRMLNDDLRMTKQTKIFIRIFPLSAYSRGELFSSWMTATLPTDEYATLLSCKRSILIQIQRFKNSADKEEGNVWSGEIKND